MNEASRAQQSVAAFLRQRDYSEAERAIATRLFCGMAFATPLTFHAALRTTPASLSRAASRVASRLAKQKRTTFLTAPSA